MSIVGCAVAGMAVVVCLGGCQTTCNGAAGQEAREYVRQDDRHGSLVLTAEPLAWEIRRNELQNGWEGPAWYEGRNDRMKYVEDGYAGPVYERQVTRTWDRQYQSGGRVRDYYSSQTYRVKVEERVR